MSDDNPARSLVAGRFRIRALLGSGGTASVYEAVDTATGGVVAVKLLHPHLAGRAGARAAFLREAERVRDVHHAALAGVVDSGVAGDADADAGPPTAWTAWELAPGRTLAEIVRAEGPLPVGRAVEVVRRVLSGLGALHDAGLVHRDVTPANIVVDLAGGVVRDVRIVDVGLVDVDGTTAHARDIVRSVAAEVADAGGAAGADAAAGTAGILGTVAYAAPEQLRGEPMGVPADLYQAAGTLYFAIVGTAPFPRPSASATARAHLEALPPTASVRARGVPLFVDRAIVRAMLKQPEARFVSAADFVAALTPQEVPAARVVDAPARTRLLPSSSAGASSALSAAAVIADRPTPVRAPAGMMWGLVALGVVVLAAVVAAFTAVPPTVAAPSGAATSMVAPPPTAEPSVSRQPAPPAPAAVPAPVAVPPVEGLAAESALLALDGAGLTLGHARTIDSPSSAGTVLAIEPAAGTLLAAGATVTLVVASGNNAVPDVAGVSLDAAAEAVAAAGFTVVRATAPDPGAGAAPVRRTVPGGGTVLAVGTSVVLEPDVRPTPAPSPTAAPTPGGGQATP